MPKHHSINYVELPAEDFARQEAFYSAAFGWTFISYGDEYHAFNAGGFDGGFYRAPLRSRQGEGAALVVLYSSDLEASHALVTEHGGEIVKEIFSFPGGRRFHFTDPHGNELAVWSDGAPPA